MGVRPDEMASYMAEDIRKRKDENVQLKGMLHEAWKDAAMLNRVHQYDEVTEEDWLADLRARIVAKRDP